MVWVQFILSAALIVFAGIRLTVYADILSERIKLGKVWVGIVLLGFVTSLPEAVSSLTAVISLKSNDLAIGNMLGSNNFNIFLIVVMDLLYRQSSVTDKIVFDRARIMPAVFAALLVLPVAAGLSFGSVLRISFLPSLSMGTLVIAVGYFSTMKILSLNDSLPESPLPGQRGEGLKTKSIKLICGQLALSGALVVIGAVWLANVSDVIADVTGWGRTFVGTMFLAFATSLPEMVVTISAVRIGGLDLALGNIFGSNIVNMFIIFLCDLFYTRGSILETVSRTHVLTAVLSILLTCVVVMGIKHKNKKLVMGMGWDSWLVAALFFAGSTALFLLK